MSHQTRRTPLPADYQFPTNCACPSCKGLLTPETGRRSRLETPQWMPNEAMRFIKPVAVLRVAWDERGYTTMGLLPDQHCCPKCQGPSYRGGLCVNCTTVAEPSHDTPWGV